MPVEYQVGRIVADWNGEAERISVQLAISYVVDGPFDSCLCVRANYCYVVVVVYDEHEWTRFGQFGEFGGRERDNRK